MKRTFAAIALLLSVAVSSAQTGTEKMLVTDMLKIKTVGNLAAHPDGSRVVFTVTAIEPDERSKADYRYVTQLYSATADGAPVQLTFAKESSSSPVWSPDGKYLAFVRSADGKPQVFILPVTGGEAYQLTRGTYGAGNPRWSPDGKRILFSSPVPMKDLLKDSVLNAAHSYPAWPMEKPGITYADMKDAANAKADPNGNENQVRAWLLANEADGKATVLNKLNFQDEANISGAMSFTQFFVTDVAGGQPKPVATGFNRFGAIEFTPDGQKLLLTADIDSLEHPDRSRESQIYIADTDGRNMRMLLGKNGAIYTSGRVSPSGKWLAYQYGSTEGEVAQLAIMPVSGKESDAVTFPFDRSKGGFAWSADEKAIFFTAQSNGGTVLYKLDIASKKITPLSDFSTGITSFALAGPRIFYGFTDVTNPSELYVADALLKNGKKLSSFNAWVATKKLSVPQKHTFVNNKGQAIEYWVMKPTAYQPGKKYPLLLEIHGGPSAMWGPGEAGMWHEYQYFCSQGYGVVYGNPRGSGGYGHNFIRANVGDWGTGPASDVLTTVDKTVDEGWVDTSRLLITGGSYAGYLTAWIIAHDKRFKAACAQRGVYDLATFFGEGNAWRLVPHNFGGYPWEPKVKELLERESPFSYVQNITTPFIIFHGDNDRRTGFVQSEMMYRSLKVLGRPVEYVRHPGATHEITRSGDNRQRIDQMLRTYEFFNRWID